LVKYKNLKKNSKKTFNLYLQYLKHTKPITLNVI